MCRLLAYQGPAIALERLLITPCHSLLHQSRAATEAKLSVNGDGFGVAWYTGQDPAPGLYRDVLPAWSDTNLASLCRVVRAPLCLAHVRAATFGEIARSNCQPFTHGNWSFAHNGQLADFASRRRAYEALISDDIFTHRRGSTDSEVLFLTLLTNGLDQDPDGAITRTIDAMARTGSGAATPTRMACVLSDGARVWGWRWSSDGRAPTLYRAIRPLTAGGLAFSSEALDAKPAGWALLPEGVPHILTGAVPTAESAA